MEIVHSEEYQGFKIDICPDFEPMSPADWGDEGLLLVHYHRDCWIESEVCPDSLASDVYHFWAEDEPAAPADEDDEDEYYGARGLLAEYWAFPVAAYIHGGVVLSLGSGFHFPDFRWDVSHVGLALVKRSEAETEDQARKLAAGLISEWNCYLSGQVYGYTVRKVHNCSECGAEVKDVHESCWGFYGDYQAEGGCLAEARGLADWLVKQPAEPVSS